MTQLSIDFEYETIAPTGARKKDDTGGESSNEPFPLDALFA